MQEFDFIRQYMSRHTADGELLRAVGDDSAIIRPQAGKDWHLSTDMLLAGRHFLETDTPEDIAIKVLHVNLSDMAAMGATPKYILLASSLPKLEEAWVKRFCDTFFSEAEKYNVRIIGGDTTQGAMSFCITIIGTTPQNQALQRNRAEVGDDIWVSGQIGLASAGLAVREGKITLPETLQQACIEQLLRPQARVALGEGLLSLAHSGMDISDGLAQDLAHILEQSHVGARLDVDNVPTLEGLAEHFSGYEWLLSGGDDYELVFTAGVPKRADIEKLGQALNIPLTRIGKILPYDEGYHFVNQHGQAIQLTYKGYNHFG